MADASRAKSLPASSANAAVGDALIEKVLYKGFIHCDHPTRLPNEYTVAGIHDIFRTKKQMKQAQEENPLAGRGYKKAVMLMASLDGFRLDMFSKDAEGSLLQAPVDKVVLCHPIDKWVYIIVRRGKLDGKYTCHAMVADGKAKGLSTLIAAYMNHTVAASAEGRHDRSEGAAGLKFHTLGGDLGGKSPIGRRGGSSIHNNEHAAALRKASAAFIDEVEDPASAGISQYVGGGGGDDEDNLNLSDVGTVQRLMSGDDDPEPSASGSMATQPWYHGDCERMVAERRLLKNPPGTFLVRESSDKTGFSLSLINVEHKVRHFKILSRGGDRWALHGHENSYLSVVSLIEHYGLHDITQEGDRCLEPCREL